MPGNSPIRPVGISPFVYRGAREICEVVKVDWKKIDYFIKEEGLPAWKRTSAGVYFAIPSDLEKWVVDQRDKYINNGGR